MKSLSYHVCFKKRFRMSSGLMMPCVRRSTPSVVLNSTLESSEPLSLPLTNVHSRTNHHHLSSKTSTTSAYPMDYNGIVDNTAAISATSCVGKYNGCTTSTSCIGVWVRMSAISSWPISHFVNRWQHLMIIVNLFLGGGVKAKWNIYFITLQTHSPKTMCRLCLKNVIFLYYAM